MTSCKSSKLVISVSILYAMLHIAICNVDNKCPCHQIHCQYCSVVGQYQFIEGRHVKHAVS